MTTHLDNLGDTDLGHGMGKRTMTSTEFRAALKRLGFATSDAPNDLGLSEAARFFGASPRQVRAWAADAGTVPPAIAKFLRLMLKLKLSRERVAKLLGEG